MNPRREPAPEDLDEQSGGFVVGGQRVGTEPGTFASDADDHFVSESDLVGIISQPPLTVFAREVAISPLELSRALQTRLEEVRGGEGGAAASSPESLTERLRMNIEAMHVELAELLMELPWKEWKSYDLEKWYDALRLAAIKEEVIDLYFFLNNMFIALGCDDREIQRLYERKYETNMARQKDGGVYR